MRKYHCPWVPIGTTILLVCAACCLPAAALAQSSSAGTTPSLPQQDGQRWHEYDLRPYTDRLQDVEQPQQAIVDWILRETGTEIWFSEPFGFMSASRETLRVYHVPEVQQRVKSIVDRFVSGQMDRYVLGVRLLTVGSPNWRALALPMLRPVPVQSAGVDAWLISKENAAVLLAQLRKRTDFSEHSSPNLIIHNGQSHTMNKRQPRSYLRSIRPRKDGWPGYESEPGQLDEGYSLLISPLMSLDGTTVDAVIKCQVDQIEKFLPVQVDLPGAQGTQRLAIEVPQLVSWRLHERFRWPADQVLLLSCGVVAAPDHDRSGLFGLPLMAGGPRADALLMLDCKGQASAAPLKETRTAGAADTYRGRY